MGETLRGPQPVVLTTAGGVAKRGRPRKTDFTIVEEKHVAHGICAIFGGIFTLLTVFDPSHPHAHWIKTTDKVTPISDPTTDWLNSLDEEVRKRVQGGLLPAAILGGIAQVVGRDIQIEMEMRRLERQAMRVPPVAPPMAAPSPPPAQGGPQVVSTPIGDTGVVTAVTEDL